MLKRILFIPDVHIPYHNKKAFKLMLKVCLDFKPDIIIILGDFSDFYAVSKFSKDPSRKLNLKWEIECVNEYLDMLDTLGAVHKIYVSGNHEHRLNVFIATKAPELFGLINVEEAFRLAQRGWRFIPYRKDIKVGKVYVTHDVNNTGRNAGQKLIDTYLHSVIAGHSHRLIYMVESDGVGNPILSAQFGWLGDVSKIDYVHRITAVKSYVLGFGLGYMEQSTGLVYATPVPIIRGKCLYDGKLYKN